MIDESEKKGGMPLPPKLDLRKQNILKDRATEVPGITFKPPAGAEVKKPAAPAAVSPVPAAQALKPAAKAKKETSRIPLEVAKPSFKPESAQPSNGPKPVHLQPPAPAPGVLKVSKPATVPQTPSASAEATGLGLTDKRKTSRISLEAALALEAKDMEKPAEGAPKTIRLKRPSETTAGKVLQRPQVAIAGDKGVKADEKVDMSKTARLDELHVEKDGPTPTRRKTIRVKRPTKQPEVKGVSIARADTAERPESKQAEFAVAAEDEPSWIFPVITIAAILVVCVTIYVLVAQTFGPNVSLTRLSYGSPGLDLAWPRKIR